MDLWRQCAEWLSLHGVIPRDHRMLRKDATYLEFVNLIRDGVLLCHLLNKIEPGSVGIDDMSLRPQLSQILCLKNISTFLNSCKNHFDIKDEHLFEPYMLFDYHDVGKVIYMISKLSKCEKSRATNIPGFPKVYVKREEFVSFYKSENKKEDIKQSQLYDKFEVYQAMSEQCNIYDEIYEIIGHESRLEVDQTYSEPKDYVTAELFKTEVDYIATLASIEKIFKARLKSVMKPEDFNMVFRNISELHALHNEFLGELRQYFNGQAQMSEIFLRFQDRFLIYADVCLNLKHAQDKLVQLCTCSHPVRRAIMIAENEATDGKFRLHDILTVPYARFLKYSQLVESLLSNSSKTDKDYHRLQEVVTMLKDIYAHCNESKRDKENMEDVKKIEDSIINFRRIFSTSLSEYGRLLKEGTVTCRFPEVKLKRVHVLLFEQSLMFCEEIKGSVPTLLYKEGVRLVSTDIEDDVPQTFKNKNFFILKYRPENGPMVSFTISLKTTDQKMSWIELIKKAKASLVPHNYNFGKHVFVLGTFPAGSVCWICQKLLRGLINQGYKCNRTACGAAVHMNCINRCDPCGLKRESSVFRNDRQLQPSTPPFSVAVPLEKTHSLPELITPKSVATTGLSKSASKHAPAIANSKPSLKVLPHFVASAPNILFNEKRQSFEERPKVPSKPNFTNSPTSEQSPPRIPDSLRISFSQELERSLKSLTFLKPVSTTTLQGYHSGSSTSLAVLSNEVLDHSSAPENLPPKLPSKSASLVSSSPEIISEPGSSPVKNKCRLNLPTLPSLVSSSPEIIPESGCSPVKSNFPARTSLVSPLPESISESPLKDNFRTTPSLVSSSPESGCSPNDKSVKSNFREERKKRLGVPVMPLVTSSDFSLLKMRNNSTSSEPPKRLGRVSPIVMSQSEASVNTSLPSSDLGKSVLSKNNRLESKSVSSIQLSIKLDKPQVSLGSTSNSRLTVTNVKYVEHLRTFQEPESSNLPKGENLNFRENSKPEVANLERYEPSSENEEEMYEAVNVKAIDACTPGFLGEMDSQTARRLLHDLPDGTYLVRERQGEYAVSLSFKNSVRHIKIFSFENGQVCFAAVKRFDTVQALISFYKQHSLLELFRNLDTCLIEPYRL